MNIVTLLIPVYNDQPGLNLSLSTLPDDLPLDVVVVDDGSEPPIQLQLLPAPHWGFMLRLEKNRGIEHALNHGLSWILDQGYEYVARLDSGDVSLPQRFTEQLAFLQAHPSHALVGGQVRFVDAAGREVFRERFPTSDEKIRRAMHARNCFIHPAVMLRTTVLREVGLYSDRYKAAEDYELFFRVTQNYKVANLETEVVSVHLNPRGISLKKRRRQIVSRLKVMLRYFDPLKIESYVGLVKNVALLVTPTHWVTSAKQLLGERRRGWL